MAGGRPRRYAEALFEIAKGRGALDAWRDGLHVALQQLGDERVLHELSNPELQYEQVRQALQRTLGDKVAPEVMNLLLLLLRRQHLPLLPRIVQRYDELVNRERRIETAAVQTAVPLTPQELELLERRLAERRHASSVILQQHVDPAMLGGIVIRIGDTLLDGSVGARLAGLRQALLRERA